MSTFAHFLPQARAPEEGECPIFSCPSLQPKKGASSHSARRAVGREAQINTASPGMSAPGAVSNLQHWSQAHSRGQQSSCWQEPFEPGLAQSLEPVYKQGFCGLQQSGALFVEELGPGPRVVMKKELQESCTHRVGAGRKEAVPGRGVNMLLAEAHKLLESEMGGGQMVHLGCVLMKICNPLTLHCIQSLRTVPAQWPFICLYINTFQARYVRTWLFLSPTA